MAFSEYEHDWLNAEHDARHVEHLQDQAEHDAFCCRLCQ